MNRTLPLALLGLLTLTTGCTLHSNGKVTGQPPSLADRSTYIDQRSQELIRRGVPKDAALAKASGEWFNELSAADRRAEDNQRGEQRILERKLAEMSRNRSDAR